jgi:hypothetical protein
MHEKEFEKLYLYTGWLYTLRLWQLNLFEIGFLAPLVAKAAGDYVAVTTSWSASGGRGS